MREFAYQRNQEFSRYLRTELAHLSRPSAQTQLLDRAGPAASSPLSPGDLAFIASSVSAHASEHLANVAGQPKTFRKSPEHTSAQLGGNWDFSTTITRGLDDRPGLSGRPRHGRQPLAGSVAAGHSWPISKSQDCARRDELWSGHVRKLNGELLDRAGPTFTRVIGEEILKRSEDH